ncbi:hypothetical protein NAPIS_ORF00977 [Vairimorpha apis BRL 01]|uniref:Uncharacterized protein n=1 Tax=Vairimorpha apis BRL 01 TaxID=1037528 RepID=T0L1V3_9MICR|nr:hypothetical protein NAPIS_ORF00977 [Vairimorpha apis BRL 01]
MFLYLTIIFTLESYYDNDFYTLNNNYNAETVEDLPILNQEQYDMSTPTEEGNFVPSVSVDLPKNAFRSIRYGKIKTNPENLETLIQHEMKDISPDLHNKITKKLANSNVDRTRYKDLFFIKKRIIQDGKRKVVTFDIQEKIIPKNGPIDPLARDFSLRIMLAGILFLLAGLVFTTTMKAYQNVFKNKYIKYENNKEQIKDNI